jgi:hypothetical protein
MGYQMAGGGGPAGTVARAGANKVGFNVLRLGSLQVGAAPALTKANVVAARRAIRAWGVTLVVVPVDTGLAKFQVGRGVAYGVALLTAVLGSRPTYQDHAWVWTDLSSRPNPVAVSPSVLAQCVGQAVHGSETADPWAPCVLRRAAPRVAGLR